LARLHPFGGLIWRWPPVRESKTVIGDSLLFSHAA
jgi:hypothetical protein